MFGTIFLVGRPCVDCLPVMTAGVLLRLNGREAVVQLDSGGVICVALDAPPGISAREVSPLTPVSCVVNLGIYEMDRKRFRGSLVLPGAPPGSGQDPLPACQRMAYRKSCKRARA